MSCATAATNHLTYALIYRQVQEWLRGLDGALFPEKPRERGGNGIHLIATGCTRTSCIPIEWNASNATVPLLTSNLQASESLLSTISDIHDARGVAPKQIFPENESSSSIRCSACVRMVH